MLLIYPPSARPSEPPAGIARLSGFLQANGRPCRLLDANLEATLWLLEQPVADGDTWTRRAAASRYRHLTALRNPDTCRFTDRYRRAVSDLNRLLAAAGEGVGVIAGLADYQDRNLSPVRSSDLLQAAEQHERNLFAPWFAARFPAALDGVDTVGFSLTYLSQALTTFAMIGYLRRHFPEKRIVIGGGLVTSWMRRPGWVNPFGVLVDDLIAGPGEPALPVSAAPTAGPIVCTLPDYGGLPLDRYLSPGRIIPYSASAGCYWNRCSFCPEPAEGNRYQPVPPQRAVADLLQLTAAYRPALLHLLDNAISPALLHQLQQSPPGTPWYGFARFTPELADPDYCRCLKESGCVMLKLGLESGDQGVLDSLDKGIDLRLAAQVLDALHGAGIGVYLYLLFGTPSETESAARRTLDFVVRHSAAISFLNLAIFNMPVSSTEAEAYATGPFYDGDLSLYTAFRHPAGWNRQQVRRFLDRDFKRHPAVAAIVRRDPLLFTSSHAPFFC